MKLKTDIQSWKTTIVGFLTGMVMLVSQVINLLDEDPETVFKLEIFLAALAAMGIGLFAKDGDKTSKELGLGESK